MSFSDTPNRLEAVFIQRDITNSRYDQINISGSDLIIYLDPTGSINADKITTWAAKYNIGVNGTVSQSISSSYTKTASLATFNSQSFRIPIIQAGSSSVSAATSDIIIFDNTMPNTSYVVSITGESFLSGSYISGKTVHGFTSSFALFTGIYDWIIVSSTQ